jgi:hypothetical protein
MSDKDVFGDEERDFSDMKSFRDHSKQPRCQERAEELFREVCLGTHDWKELCVRSA